MSAWALLLVLLAGSWVGAHSAPTPALWAPWREGLGRGAGEDLTALGPLPLSSSSLDNLLEELPELAPLADLGDTGAPAWQPAEPDPQLYLLTELDRNARSAPSTRVKRDRVSPRNGGGQRLSMHREDSMGSNPRLSIVNPLDVLRQRLLLEIARRRKWQNPQLDSNREMLESIGKRSGSGSASGSASGSGRGGQGQGQGPVAKCLLLLGQDNPNSVYWKDKSARMAALVKLILDGKCDLESDDPMASGPILADQAVATENDRAVHQQSQSQQQQQRQQQRDAADEQHADSIGWRRRISGWSRSQRSASQTRA